MRWRTTTPPTSPSKTMDPRRWSPSKSSSWLEAALNKPESPKPKATPPPTKTSPLDGGNSTRLGLEGATGGGVGLGRAPSVARKHEVKTGGLLRSSPMGTNVKQASLGGFPAVLPPRQPRSWVFAAASKASKTEGERARE